MRLFKKKPQSTRSSVLADEYVPAALPSYGQGLETFVAGEYSLNRPETAQAAYQSLDAQLDQAIATCDEHASGAEFDHYVDAQIEVCSAVLECETADHESQIARLRAARKMRAEALEREIDTLRQRSDKLEEEIAPLEGLRARFRLRIGRFSLSLGLLVTMLAMLVDAAVNYSFLESILLGNAALLIITVACMSLMSDASMCVLGTFLSCRKEPFTSRGLFRAVCWGLLAMFLLSVIASVMVRFGSMDATYGTVDASGAFVGKESYSLAEYGVSLVTAFITTATGILSFALSLDENADKVTLRERLRKELRQCLDEQELLRRELALLENAPDPQLRDERKRAAAAHHREALRTGLKLHVRKVMTLLVKDPTFTEEMGASGRALTDENLPLELADYTPVPLDKIS